MILLTILKHNYSRFMWYIWTFVRFNYVVPHKDKNLLQFLFMLFHNVLGLAIFMVYWGKSQNLPWDSGFWFFFFHFFVDVEQTRMHGVPPQKHFPWCIKDAALKQHIQALGRQRAPHVAVLTREKHSQTGRGNFCWWIFADEWEIIVFRTFHLCGSLRCSEQKPFEFFFLLDDKTTREAH